jgi:hypothetical protein
MGPFECWKRENHQNLPVLLFHGDKLSFRQMGSPSPILIKIILVIDSSISQVETDEAKRLNEILKLIRTWSPNDMEEWFDNNLHPVAHTYSLVELRCHYWKRFECLTGLEWFPQDEHEAQLSLQASHETHVVGQALLAERLPSRRRVCFLRVCLLSSPQLGFFLHLLLRNPQM